MARTCWSSGADPLGSTRDVQPEHFGAWGNPLCAFCGRGAPFGLGLGRILGVRGTRPGDGRIQGYGGNQIRPLSVVMHTAGPWWWDGRSGAVSGGLPMLDSLGQRTPPRGFVRVWHRGTSQSSLGSDARPTLKHLVGHTLCPHSPPPPPPPSVRNRCCLSRKPAVDSGLVARSPLQEGSWGTRDRP